MMQPTLSPETIQVLLDSPLTKNAIAAREKERHAARRELLEKIAAAERDRAAAVQAAVEPLPALRAAHAEAHARLYAATAAVRQAEAAARDGQCGHDARIDRLRDGLRALGGDAIAALRVLLAVESRSADALDDFRPQTTLGISGARGYSTLHVDGGAAARRKQIAAAGAELDKLAFDPEASPAAIESRCAAIRAEVEAGPVATVLRAERITPEDIWRSPPATVIRRAMRKYLHR